MFVRAFANPKLSMPMRTVIPPALASRLSQPLLWRRLVVGLLLVWICIAFARLVWVLTRPGPELVPAVAASGMTVVMERSVVDIDALVEGGLFGEHSALADSEATPVINVEPGIEDDAGTTGLDLALEGLVAADQPGLARAMIRHQGQRAQYAVGDKLPVQGNVILAKVLVDRVILDNGGRYESLWLYDPNASGQGVNAQRPPPKAYTPKALDLRQDVAVTDVVSDLRDKVYTNPATLAEVIRVSVARDGDKLLGYRIAPGRDQEQFQRMGFKTGDVVLRINDTPLDDPRRALELYNLLRDAREASFTVRRDDTELTLMVSLEDAS